MSITISVDLYKKEFRVEFEEELKRVRHDSLMKKIRYFHYGNKGHNASKYSLVFKEKKLRKKRLFPNFLLQVGTLFSYSLVTTPRECKIYEVEDIILERICNEVKALLETLVKGFRDRFSGEMEPFSQEKDRDNN